MCFRCVISFFTVVFNLQVLVRPWLDSYGNLWLVISFVKNLVYLTVKFFKNIVYIEVIKHTTIQMFWCGIDVCDTRVSLSAFNVLISDQNVIGARWWSESERVYDSGGFVSFDLHDMSMNMPICRFQTSSLSNHYYAVEIDFHIFYRLNMKMYIYRVTCH